MANKLNSKNLKKLRQQSDLQEQATVKNSLAGFYNATENSFSGVIILDSNFHIAYLNEAAAQNHGFDRTEMAGHNFWELINCPKSVKNKIIKGLQKGSWSGKFEINGGLNIKNKLNIFISQLPIASSNRHNFVVAENKVIDSRQAEERLKLSEDRFKLIFKYAPDTIFLIDTKSTIIDCNDAAEKLTGYKRSELIGKNFFKFKLIDSSNYLKIGKNLVASVLGKPTGPDEYLVVQKDGARIVAEVRTYPVKMDNKIIILGIARNITEKKAMESRLAESEAKYRALIEGTSDIVYSADLQGNLTYISPRISKYGYQPQELIGKNFINIIYPDDRGALIEDFKKTISTGLEFPSRFRLLLPHKNTANFWFEETGRAIKDSSNKIIGINGIVRDITERKIAEKALQDARERFQILFESNRDAIMTLEPPTWKFTSGNQATIEMFKAKNEQEFISKTPGDLSPKKQPDGRDSGEKAKEMITTAMDKGSHFFDWTHKRIDGEEFPANVLLTKVELAQKVFLQATVRDITEQKAAEQKIKESEERYRALFEASADGILIADIETKKFQFANPAFCRMLGYSRDELLKMSVFDIHPKKELPYVLSEFDAQAKHKKILAENIPCLRKNGSIFYADVNATQIIFSGRPHNVGLFRDITERKIFIERLQATNEEIKRQKLTISKFLNEVTLEKNEVAKEKEKLSTILKSIGDGVIVVDKEQKVIFLNPVAEDITGWPLKQAKNQDLAKVFNIFDEGTMKKRTSPVAKALKTGQISKLANHTIIKRKDGQIIPISDSAAPIRDAKKKIFGAVLVFRDVIKERIAEGKLILAGTKLKQYNQELDKRVAQKTKDLSKALEELKSLDALKDEFLNISAHELKTPLTSIIGLTELILLKKQGNISGQQEKSLQIVNKESTRLLNIIRRILDITRIEAKRAIFDIKEINPCEVLPGVVESLKTLAKNTGIQIICNQPPEKILVKADSEKLNEVVYNLIDNALKFSPENGKIFVTGEVTDQEFILSVKDQGPGIDPESKKRLFQKFSQLDTGFSRQQEGTGLGLYISKIMIEGMGGKIWVESELGKGANFKFSLPLADNKNAS